jgi:uncharacterized membrane protein
MPDSKPSSHPFRNLFAYFLRGVLFMAPVSITIYAIIAVVRFLDNLIPGIYYPGVGLLIILVVITFIGYYSYSFLFQHLMEWIEKLFFKAPITKLIYGSIKDLFGAFVGDKKTFTQPVMVLLFKEAGIQKLGFITNNDLSEIGIKDKVAVYFPHSYNFSGNLYIVPKENITILSDFKAADAMKFIVSGGVTGLNSKSSDKI